jgi:hypothetical protein
MMSANTTNQIAATIHAVLTRHAPGMEIDLRAAVACESAEEIGKRFQVELKEVIAMPETEKNIQTQANEYADCAIANIQEMLDALHHAQSGCTEEGCPAGKDAECPEDWHNEDAARQRIEEDALCVEVRSDWHTPCEEGNNTDSGEYNILLTTGGPAARIIGDHESGQPTTARFEWQDWGIFWTKAQTTTEQNAAILEYAQCLYFGS